MNKNSELTEIEEVKVTAASGSYHVKIGTNILGHAKEWLHQNNPKFVPTVLVLITDVTVYQLYKEVILSLLRGLSHDEMCPIQTFQIGCWDCDVDGIRQVNDKENQAIKALVITVPDGEHSKSRELKSLIENVCFEHQCDKSTLFIGFGGGMVGDLTGFIAATFYRGCRFIQIPTSLLAMVDSSTGGKTAVNSLPYGKNLVGCYLQPSLVIVDLQFCKTLAKRLISDGLAEIIKSGLTSMKSVFELCERLGPKFKLSGSIDPHNLHYLICKTIQFKADVVGKDERDFGLRNILNFGHTIGHAIEALPTNKWLHGECVSVGIVYELIATRALRLCDEGLPSRAEFCLQNYGLPTRVPPSIDIDSVMASMILDKKNVNRQIRIVAVTEVGSVAGTLMQAVPETLIRRVLSFAVSLSSSSPSATLNPSSVLVTPPRIVSSGVVNLPGSKSIANRALLLAALGEGSCLLANLPPSEDVQIMKHILHDVFGLTMKESRGLSTSQTTFSGLGWCSKATENVHQCKPDQDGNVSVWVENAGTVARFLPPIFAFLLSDSIAGVGKLTSITVDGNHHMRLRPIGDLIQSLTSSFVGIEVEYLVKEDCLPLRIRKSQNSKSVRFPGGVIEIHNRISSQFASALLMISPLADSIVELRLLDLEIRPDKTIRAVSQPYIDMTIEMMNMWGISVERKDSGTYRIPTGRYINPPVYAVEADASAASYPLAFAAISGGRVAVNIPTPTENSKPLQGDTQFMTEVLVRMGCTMTPNSPKSGYTTIQGPGNGELTPIQIDMNEMTDTFMTAGVLMARAAECINMKMLKVSHSSSAEPIKKIEERFVSRITGVANQRVKECDRIDSMIDNLTRLGFDCRELSDGIEIYPSSPIFCNSGSTVIIDPRNDHRLAMSFAVMSSTVERIQIPEWRCVEKTFPTFWDMCEKDLGIKVSGVELPASIFDASDAKAFGTRPIIWLIGMRSVGKTQLGQAAARQLGFEFRDLDDTIGFDVHEFVLKKGWEEFRKREFEHFFATLTALNKQYREHRRYLPSAPNMQPPLIVGCGGGIVEIPEVIPLLMSQQFVIWVKMEEIGLMKALEEMDSEQPGGRNSLKPSYTQPAGVVYMNRKELYKKASRFEFITAPLHTYSNLPDANTVIDKVFCRFLQSVIGAKQFPVLPNSKFLSLTSSTYAPVSTYLDVDAISKNVDALEVRIDLLTDPLQFAEEIFHIRQRTNLPLIFTLRSVSEGGNWDKCSSDYSLDSYFSQALRLAPEYLDVEYGMFSDQSVRQRLLSNSHLGTRFIISRHAPRMHVPKHDWEIKSHIRQLSQYCRTSQDIIKIVYGPSIEDTSNDALRLAVIARAESQSIGVPIIALILSTSGELSRYFNESFTPVTHPALSPAAPGQLSAAAINQRRQALGLTCNNFAVFGNSVEKSPSPTLHNSIFQHLGFLYAKYTKIVASTTTILRATLQSPSFVGASITIPLKEQIIEMARNEPEIFVIDETVRLIGAGNTVVRNPLSRRFLITNTDYLAILKGLMQMMDRLNQYESKYPQQQLRPYRILIIGAGGTARAAVYASQRLKGEKEIFIWNRTESRAAALASEFNIKTFSSGDSVPAGGFIAIIGTIPGASVPEVLNNDAVFTSPRCPQIPPIVMDMAYTPPMTPLLKKALYNSCSVITGLELFLWQGIEQSKLFISFGLISSTQPELTVDWEEVLKAVSPQVANFYRETQELKEIYEDCDDGPLPDND